MAIYSEKMTTMENDITEIRDRLEKLEKAVFGEGVEKVPTEERISNLDFSLNERAFIKKYSHGFNGQKFFTLITAYLSGGKESSQIDVSIIQDVWKRCLGIIGLTYAPIFSTRAKENGWVDVPKDTRGSYVLGKHWQEISQRQIE